MANPMMTRGDFAGYASAGAPAQTQSVVESDTMTVEGTAIKSFILLAVIGAGAVVGWKAVDVTTRIVTNATTGASEKVSEATIPPFLIAAALGAFVLALVTIFKPNVARVTAPIYALAEGYVLGAISRFFDIQYDGIVKNAIFITFAIFAVMFLAYTSRTIRATPRFKKVMFTSMIAILLYYGVGMIAMLFGNDFISVNNHSVLAIAISVGIVIVASFSLILDFDVIERSAAMHAPKSYEWYGAFSLMVTLVWLYLEVLKLLARLQRN